MIVSRTDQKSGQLLVTTSGSSTLDALDGGRQDAEGHRQAMVVVGGQLGAVQRRQARCAGRRPRRRPRAPVLASSAARSPRRSLSFSRMNPTPPIVVGVDAVAATTASVGTRSEMPAMSTSMPRSGTCRIPFDRQSAAPVADRAAHAGEQVDERGVALEAVAVQAADLDAATGDGGHGERVAGRRGVRLDVEHGAGVAARRARRSRSSPTLDAGDPERRHHLGRHRQYGADTSGVVGSSRSPPSSNGPISISAVRNWLDTSPATSTLPPRRSGPRTVTGRWPGRRDVDGGAEPARARRAAGPSAGAAAAARRRWSPGRRRARPRP